MQGEIERLIRSATGEADDVSDRMSLGGYRANRSDTERLRTFVRRLADALAASESSRLQAERERDEARAERAKTRERLSEYRGDELAAERRAVAAEALADARLEALKETEAERDQARATIQDLARELRRLVQYGRWTIGPESPSHHPTLPSAVGAAAELLREHGLDESVRRAALLAQGEAP